MANTRRRPSRRRPSWWRRNRWLVVGASAAIAVVVAIAVAQSGGDDNGNGDDRVAAGGAVVGGDLHSLVADPTTAGRVYVGGHAAVARSDDDGKTWSAVPSLDDADAMGWGFRTEAVYVSGHPGLNRSSDGGRSFRRVNDGLPDTDVHAFGVGTRTLYGSSPAVGVFASDDGGTTWSVRTADAGQPFFGRIVVDPADDNHVLAADARSGVMESRDGGRSWQRTGLLPSAVWLSSGKAGLYASGPQGAARRGEDGAWAVVRLPEAAQLVEASPTDPNLLYAAGLSDDKAEVWVSRDAGSTWTRP